MVDDAIAILKVAIQLYPKQANLYDSVGEFLLRKDEKAQTLESYKKLELNAHFPNATAAREIVKRLTDETAAKVK